MKPAISDTDFGSITVSGERYERDIIIRLNGKIEKRKKKLSKAEFGTSHIVSIEEAEFLFEPEADALIIGTGQSGQVVLSSEAAAFFQHKRCSVRLLPTPEAITAWNDATGKVIGMFHVTC